MAYSKLALPAFATLLLALPLGVSGQAPSSSNKSIVVETHKAGQNVANYKELSGSWKEAAFKSRAAELSTKALSRQLEATNGKLDGRTEFHPPIPTAGKYSLELTWPDPSNAKGVTVSISLSGAPLDSKQVDFVTPSTGTNSWMSLGEYELPAGDNTVITVDASTSTGPGDAGKPYMLILDGIRLRPRETVRKATPPPSNDPFAAADSGAAGKQVAFAQSGDMVESAKPDPFAGVESKGAGAPAGGGTDAPKPAPTPRKPGKGKMAPGGDPFAGMPADEEPAAAPAGGATGAPAPTELAQAEPPARGGKEAAFEGSQDMMEAARPDPFSGGAPPAAGKSSTANPFSGMDSAPSTPPAAPQGGMKSSAPNPFQDAPKPAAPTKGPNPFADAMPNPTAAPADSKSVEISSAESGEFASPAAKVDPFAKPAAAAAETPAPTPAPEVKLVDRSSPVMPSAKAPAPTPAPPAIVFRPNLEAAKEEAARNKRNIIIIFSSNTKPMERFRSQVLTNPGVARAMDRLVAVEADMTEYEELARQYNVASAPYAVILDPHGYTLAHIGRLSSANRFEGELKKYAR